MARVVDPSLDGPVIELGPGTGPVTEALIRRGIAPERLVLIEFDAAFCKLLARRYPACHIVHGDAYALGRTLGGLLRQPAAAVVSSLPLLTRPERQRTALLADAFDLMHPDAPFVQFTYGLASPIPRHPNVPAPAFRAKVSAPIWLNLPPARVWVYRAVGSAVLHPVERPSEPLDIMLDKLKARGGKLGEKLGEEWREQRERLKAELQAVSLEARADLKARAAKVRLGIQQRKARILADRKTRPGRPGRPAERLGDKPFRW